MRPFDDRSPGWIPTPAEVAVYAGGPQASDGLTVREAIVHRLIVGALEKKEGRNQYAAGERVTHGDAAHDRYHLRSGTITVI
ncbi:hypothetical protein GN244_ATG17161 [Phytophthora infestans]|uniref:Uncharacterized protein n=1 Tax=Phytophthora infestans TaxID=4787 RepID=A0A833SRY0_PHYIN|nr:hypothetical protein GN244_ATG17161 [Phytophthora infestans]KAF4149148.1 hypothetical protein GN958_ATG01689 [Phytophthora infestans]